MCRSSRKMHHNRQDPQRLRLVVNLRFDLLGFLYEQRVLPHIAATHGMHRHFHLLPISLFEVLGRITSE